MIFNSFEFIFLFLPLVIIVYFVINKFGNYTYSKIWLIVSSLFFYGYYNKYYLGIILASILFNYTIALFLHKYENNIKEKKILLLLGITFNILLLGYFKYFNFFIGNINVIFSSNMNFLNIAMPLGISFFTFQQLSFIIDTYNGKELKYDFWSYCLFVSFFPQLVAGPIVLPSEVLPQFNSNNKSINYENMNKGLYLFAMGLFKKVIIADTIAVFADAGFSASSLTFLDSWITSIAYTFQLYFDFSGYCDIAMGIALMFNIILPLNFNSPYKSSNIKEFWNRWHMTLGVFLTKYVYFPLGGSKLGKVRTLINLFIVFFISGVWHGAGWTYILWGMLHGLAIIIHRLWYYSGRKLNKYIGMFITFITVNFLWVFFRADTVGSAISILKTMFNIRSLSEGISYNYHVLLTNIGSSITSFLLGIISNYYKVATTTFILKITLVIAVIIAFATPSSIAKVKNMKFNWLKTVEIVLYLVFAAIVISSHQNSTFLYFNF